MNVSVALQKENNKMFGYVENSLRPWAGFELRSLHLFYS